MKQNFDDIQRKIDYRFNNISLLNMAMTHSSYANDHKMKKTNSNERLEFLGDAVLELLSSEYLYDTYPDKPEGELTKLRASLVSENPLANIAKTLGINDCLMLGRGEEITGGRERASITSDAVEALIGAIYLDGGMEPAKNFVRKFVMVNIDEKLLYNDSKSMLQEIVQKNKLGTLSYEIVSEKGPAHDKIYEVVCKLDDKVIGNGIGRTKKAAEQEAAFIALKKIRGTKCI
ncbi:MAG: ribonuclease III [Lachnospiraceae bacterium]|nr:ribonuclease III [Lachnospiraceae bacterium]